MTAISLKAFCNFKFGINLIFDKHDQIHGTSVLRIVVLSHVVSSKFTGVSKRLGQFTGQRITEKYRRSIPDLAVVITTQ